MKKFEIVLLTINAIRQTHKNLFGWEKGSLSLYKSNYMIGEIFPPYDIEGWKRKESQLKKTIFFYSKLHKLAENLYNIGITITPYNDPNAKEVNFFPSEKEGKIYLKMNFQNLGELPILQQIAELKKLAVYELEKTRKNIQRENKNATKEEIREFWKIKNSILPKTKEKGVLQYAK